MTLIDALAKLEGKATRCGKDVPSGICSTAKIRDLYSRFNEVSSTDQYYLCSKPQCGRCQQKFLHMKDAELSSEQDRDLPDSVVFYPYKHPSQVWPRDRYYAVNLLSCNVELSGFRVVVTATVVGLSSISARVHRQRLLRSWHCRPARRWNIVCVPRNDVKCSGHRLAQGR